MKKLIAVLVIGVLCAVGCQTVQMPDGQTVTRADVEAIQSLVVLFVQSSDIIMSLYERYEAAQTAEEQAEIQQEIARRQQMLDLMKPVLERFLNNSEASDGVRELIENALNQGEEIDAEALAADVKKVSKQEVKIDKKEAKIEEIVTE